MNIVKDEIYTAKENHFLVKIDSDNTQPDSPYVFFKSFPIGTGTFVATIPQFKEGYRELTVIERLLYV